MSTLDRMPIEEVAELLGVTASTVYAHAARGRIPCIRLGRKLVFPRAAVENWFATAGNPGPLPVRHGA